MSNSVTTITNTDTNIIPNEIISKKIKKIQIYILYNYKIYKLIIKIYMG